MFHQLKIIAFFLCFLKLILQPNKYILSQIIVNKCNVKHTCIRKLQTLDELVTICFEVDASTHKLVKIHIFTKRKFGYPKSFLHHIMGNILFKLNNSKRQCYVLYKINAIYTEFPHYTCNIQTRDKFEHAKKDTLTK